MAKKPPEHEPYDLMADPHEFTNLATDPAHEAAFERLSTRLQQWREQTEDPFLDPANTTRLRAEVESTLENGEYKRLAGWNYTAYLAPSKPASSVSVERRQARWMSSRRVGGMRALAWWGKASKSCWQCLRWTRQPVPALPHPGPTCSC